MRVSCCLVPLFLIMSFFSRKVANVFFRMLFALMILLSLICVTFFVISGYFLDTTVFSYSIKEMLDIMKSSTQAPFWSYVIILALPILFFFISKKNFKFPKVFIVVFIVAIIVSLFIPENKSKSNTFSYIKTNKEYFFWKSILFGKKYKNITQNSQLQEITEEYRSYFPQYNFKETNYPFLHKADYEDVLSSFFHMNEIPPNIVFILIEGFSQEVLDSRYQLMPFFDSLSQKSLSWKQCWSASERTFGAFPALFGALPIGEKGFMALSPYTPAYHSLLKTMGQNGYNSAFYYGGWYGFDNMENFMKENGVECPLKEWDSDIEEESIGAFWGKEDHLTFRQAVRDINFDDTCPRMDIYLTLSSHDPWEYPDMEIRQKTFENRIQSLKNITTEEKISLLQQKKVFAAFSYVDDALRQLITEYQEKAGFENTIFIITGDHSPLTRQLRGPINFHVPFIMWSPMLKEPKNLQGVVSHNDFTPTILAMLQNKYNFEVPKDVAWLNSCMDTSLTNSAETFSPFYSSDRDLIGVLYKDYLLCNEVLYHYQENNLFPINNPEKRKELERLMSMHSSLNDYVSKNDALVKLKIHDTRLNLNRTWLDENDTIATKSYFAKKTELPVVKSPDNNSDALFFDKNNEFIGFLSYKIGDNDITAFRVEVEFDIYIENDTPEAVFVCKDLKTEKGSPIYDELKNTNDWEHYSYSYTFKKEQHDFSKDDEYIIYLWNPKQLKGYLDNIKVLCIYE
ncbi:LTA synthase family protein [Bacteroidales bacterium OttesenSCG-928-C19]|nr:LTA synthase family protein [Bacteroidales bacterium OttesenSCG-928-C19]